jgi:6-phosphogluconate dehydrogenase
MANSAAIGVVGMGVMGSSLALNLADHGHTTAVYDKNADLLEAFRTKLGNAPLVCTETPEDFCAALTAPRCILLMVTAGQAVDWCIESLVPYLSPGDVIVDGGNSHYEDTRRRTASMAERGIHFCGMGVSGGEEGARRGPAMMFGGAEDAWNSVRDMLQSIAARADDGSPCCGRVGDDGAGHFVKMVHNGIEYGDMQLLCEAYALMRTVGGIEPAEQAAIFRQWNDGDLQSYLVEITAQILDTVDPETGEAMVDVILDTAGQKGTGKWTSQAALDLGAPVPTITGAVYARFLSALKDERIAASTDLPGPEIAPPKDQDTFLEALRQAVYAAKICTYAQGFQLLQTASEEYSWDLDLGYIASLWRSGCIIRARFLDEITNAYAEASGTPNLMRLPFFRDALTQYQTAWRDTATLAIQAGVAVPALSNSLTYYDSYRAAVLPANLLQAQRDFFGAHTYERTDRPRGEFFHTEWLE